jgi:hypothetical protein
MKKIALLVLCLGTLFVFTALATEAAALSAGEYKFSGVVSQVPTELASEFIEGEPISGTIEEPAQDAFGPQATDVT